MIKHKHHIIPKHAGGSNDKSNIIELTVEEHAEAHRELYEKYGRWQDHLAWQGLSGRIGKEEIIQTKNRLAHLGKEPWNKNMKGYKAGAEHYRWGKMISKETSMKIGNSLMGNECRAKQFLIINELTQEKSVVKNLRKFCEENLINYKSLHRAYKKNLVYKKTYRIAEFTQT